MVIVHHAGRSEAGNVIETHKHAASSKNPSVDFSFLGTLTRPVKQTAEVKANSKAPPKESITPTGKNGEAKPKSARRTRSRNS